DLTAGVSAVKRRVAGNAEARAGEERDVYVQPVRQPQRDAVAGNETQILELGCKRVDARLQLCPGEDLMAVAQRNRIRTRCGVLDHQRVEGIARPQSGLV